MYKQIASFLKQDKRLAKCCQFAKKYREAEKYGNVYTDFFGEEKTKEEVEEIFVEALKKFVDFIFFLDDEADFSISYTRITPDTEINMDFYKENDIDLFGNYLDYEEAYISINNEYFIRTRRSCSCNGTNLFITSEINNLVNPDIIVKDAQMIIGGYVKPLINFYLVNQNLADQFKTKLTRRTYEPKQKGND